MNTAALKAFAPAVRRQLLEAVSRKLDFVLAAQTPDFLTTYAPQVAALRRLAQENRSGLIERVAYTWFNRLTALRYLDARGWHPFRCGVLMAGSAEETQPEILKAMRTGALPTELAQHTNVERLNSLLDGHIPSTNPQGEVYRHLVLAACHFYHALLPDVFERLDDETELLLPDDLLTEHSVTHLFRTEITDEDCGEVEIIGWLYQFYISERKDEVMARKSAVPKEDIPAVTQLFTPHWIVRYLVENSLGRLWLLNRPESRLRERMPYYIEGEPEADFLRIAKPEEIRVLDPACGSGHMLTYAFDLLYAIYEEEGYPPSEIPALILRHNLHGLDICPRATQLAELALLFKAREKSRRFFEPEYLVRPHILELRDVRFVENELRDYIAALELKAIFTEPVLRLVYQFEEARNFGSLIQPCLDPSSIVDIRQLIQSKDHGSQLFLRSTQLKILRVLEQAEALSRSYHVAIANPPYMGIANFNAGLKRLAERTYPASQPDLFAMFIERNLLLVHRTGYAALITMQSWMFLSSFEELRRVLVAEHALNSMIHLGARAFDSIGGEVVQTTAFVMQSHARGGRSTVFKRLTDGTSEAAKQQMFALTECTFVRSVISFECVPGRPFAYWASPRLLQSFGRCTALKELGKPRKGLITLDDRRFTRSWWEASFSNVSLRCESRNAAIDSGKKWFPINKGGGFRKWYGFGEQVINWYRDGAELKAFIVHRYGGGSYTKEIRSEEYYFRSSITWGLINTTSPSFRYSPVGYLMGNAGPCIFLDSDLRAILGLLNSRVSHLLLELLCPTVNASPGDIAKIPVLFLREKDAHEEVVAAAIEISRADWDNAETSWDFSDQPLLRPCLEGVTLEASWHNWEAQCITAIRRMQELETENNRLLIEAYGLQDELSPEVPEEQITLARANARRDMAAFISYVVGCMMGRYSLDKPGLILANAGESLSAYLEKVGKPIDQLTFVPDEDGIVPVLDGEWFEDDVVARTREFLRATFGDATLRDNIRFIEESLGKDLRKYFLNDFYKDHLQTYKKRPIYWMVQSPRKTFSVLIYLHRYTRDTMNVVLNRYLRDYEVKLRNRVAYLAQVQADANASTRDKTAARKESDKLIKSVHDCEEWERQTILPLAQARIELDLDDGVKTNYLKLGEALAPIPGLAATEE